MIKRLHYFNQQFLREKDFSDEQTYQVSMREQHNKMLHTWGIAAGLELSTDGTQVMVQPGFAINGEGQEILLEDIKVFTAKDLSSFLGQPATITISYQQIESDHTDDAGVSGNSRWDLTPNVELLTSLPVDPKVKLILGTVTVNSDGSVKGIDPASARTIAGAKGGNLSAISLHLTGPFAGPSQQPSLSVTTAGQVDLGGSLKISQNLGVTGDAAVNGVLKLTQTSGGAPDGWIGSGSDPFKPGLNLFGIDSDSSRRKIALWGEVTQFQNDGTNRWMGTNSFGGKVGINTDAPDAVLDIGGNVAGTVQAIFARGTGLNSQLYVANGSSNTAALQAVFGLRYAGLADAATLSFFGGGVQDDPALAFNTNGHERLRINSAGKLVSPMWRAKLIMDNLPGPLPLGTTYITGGGTLIILCSGAGLALNPNDTIGMSIEVGGSPVGKAQVVANEPNSHKAFPTSMIVHSRADVGNSLEIKLVAFLNTSTNDTDFFSVLVLELPI